MAAKKPEVRAMPRAGPAPPQKTKRATHAEVTRLSPPTKAAPDTLTPDTSPSNLLTESVRVLGRLETVAKGRGAGATTTATRLAELIIDYFLGLPNAPTDAQIEAAFAVVIGGQKGKSTGARVRAFTADFVEFARIIRGGAVAGGPAHVLRMRAIDLADPAFARLDVERFAKALVLYVERARGDVDFGALVEAISDLALDARAFGATDATVVSATDMRKFRKTMRENIGSLKKRR